jgi:hypothetical protein
MGLEAELQSPRQLLMGLEAKPDSIQVFLVPVAHMGRMRTLDQPKVPALVHEMLRTLARRDPTLMVSFY